MKTNHLSMQTQLFEIVELISKRELTDKEKRILTDVLSLTHNDGYHYGCEVAQKIYNEQRSESFK